MNETDRLDGALWWDHRLVVHHATRAELTDLARLLGDPEVCRWLWFGPLEPPAVADYFGPILEAQARALERGEFAEVVELVVRDRRGGAFLGHGACVLLPDHPGTVEIGFALVRACWGQGVGSRLARFLVRVAVTELEASRIEARCLVGNTACRRLLERLGLRLERILEGHREMRGQRHDECIYAATLADLPSELLMG